MAKRTAISGLRRKWGNDQSRVLIKVRHALMSALAAVMFVLSIAISPSASFGGGALPQRQSTAAVAVDRSGNLFIADRMGLVRKVSPNGVVTVVAGYGVWGYSGDGGPATSAQISSTTVAIDHEGNLLIGGVIGASVLRRVNAAGIISTVAGTGGRATSTGDGGPAVFASVSVQAVTADRKGNIFILGNGVIRKVAPDGIISSVAGTGVPGFSGDGGPARSAQINTNQGGIAVDEAGALYIADFNNQRIRKISADGIITTIAGESTRLNNPDGVAVDAQGNVYIADEHNHRVLKRLPNGDVTAFAGTGVSGNSGDGGPAAEALLTYPRHMTVDAGGNLFIADEGSNSVRKVNTTGIISTVYPVPAPRGQRGASAPGSALRPASILALAAIALVTLERRFGRKGSADLKEPRP
jgi:hypothetical protein